MWVELLLLVIRTAIYLLTGFDVDATADSYFVEFSLRCISSSLKVKFSSKLPWWRLVLWRSLRRQTRVSINVWVFRELYLPKLGATSLNFPSIEVFILAVEAFTVKIHLPGGASSFEILMENIAVGRSYRGATISVDKWRLALETGVGGYKEIGSGSGFIADDSSTRFAITIREVAFYLDTNDTYVLLHVAKTLRDLVAETGSILKARKSQVLVGLLRANRRYTHGNGKLVAVNVKTFMSTLIFDSAGAKKVHLMTGPVRLQSFLLSADSRALFSTGSIVINLSFGHPPETISILKVGRTIGCRNKTVEGYLQVLDSVHYPAVFFIEARSEKALNVRVPRAILLGREQQGQEQYNNLKELLCSSLTKLYRLNMHISKLSLEDDNDDEEEAERAVVEVTALHFDTCRDSTADEAVALVTILEIESVVLKKASGSVVFSSADISASTAVIACSPEKFGFIPQHLGMSAISLSSKQLSICLGLLSISNGREGPGQVLLRSLSCVTTQSIRGKIGALLLSFGYARGSPRRLARILLRGSEATGMKERLSLELGVDEAEVRIYLPQHQAVGAVFNILNLAPLSTRERPPSIASSPNQRVFPAYFPLVSDRDQALDPISSGGEGPSAIMLKGRVAGVIMNTTLPSNSTMVLELSSLVLEQYVHQKDLNVPLSMQSFWLVEVHRGFRTFTRRHDTSAKRLFLYARPLMEDENTIVLRFSMALYANHAVVTSSKAYVAPIGEFHLHLVNSEHLPVLRNLISELSTTGKGQPHKWSTPVVPSSAHTTRVVILPFVLHVNRVLSLSLCRQVMRSADDIAPWLAKGLAEGRVSAQKIPFIHRFKR